MELSRRKFGQILLGAASAVAAGISSVSAAENKLAENPNSKSPVKFEIMIFDGFDDLDAYGALEALRWAGQPVQFKSVRKQDSITAVSGVKVIPSGPFDLQQPPDVLIVPGGGWPDPNFGAYAEAKRGEILEILREYHKKQGKVLASVCVGGLLLGKAGLLKDRPSTTNRGFYRELKEMGANLIEARVVDDGDIVTASGVTASIDLGLWLVQRFCGSDKALDAARELDFEMRGPIWQRPQA
jgi:transcriptional regulator GlxA family with amidase domain